MREIKFRGKDEWGNWRHGDLMKNSIPTASPVIVENFYYDDPDDSMFEVNPDTVGQFTGLKDSTGKEIYEGDIVKFCDDRAHELVGVIKWYVLACRWGVDCSISVRDCDNHPFDARYAFKIIGNVHDNPELLK